MQMQPALSTVLEAAPESSAAPPDVVERTKPAPAERGVRTLRVVVGEYCRRCQAPVYASIPRCPHCRHPYPVVKVLAEGPSVRVHIEEGRLRWLRPLAIGGIVAVLASVGLLYFFALSGSDSGAAPAFPVEGFLSDLASGDVLESIAYLHPRLQEKARRRAASLLAREPADALARRILRPVGRGQVGYEIVSRRQLQADRWEVSYRVLSGGLAPRTERLHVVRVGDRWYIDADPFSTIDTTAARGPNEGRPRAPRPTASPDAS